MAVYMYSTILTFKKYERKSNETNYIVLNKFNTAHRLKTSLFECKTKNNIMFLSNTFEFFKLIIH